MGGRSKIWPSRSKTLFIDVVWGDRMFFGKDPAPMVMKKEWEPANNRYWLFSIAAGTDIGYLRKIHTNLVRVLD
jgi:hypothetical protein